MKITPETSYNISMSEKDLLKMIDSIVMIPEENRSVFFTDLLEDLEVMAV